jgi:hypothetical protein
LLQVQSQTFFSQDDTAPKANDTFRLRRGELRLTVPRITDRLSGHIMIDPAKTTSGSNVRTRDNILQEIQLSALLRARGTGASAQNHYLDIGQFKIPVATKAHWWVRARYQ